MNHFKVIKINFWFYFSRNHFHLNQIFVTPLFDSYLHCYVKIYITMDQVTGNMKGSYYRRVIKAKATEAGSDRRRSFIPMVDCGRQEKTPGAFLLLTRYRTGLKPSGQLPWGSYYPIVAGFKSRFQNKNTLSGIVHFEASGSTNYADNKKEWQCFVSVGGSG